MVMFNEGPLNPKLPKPKCPAMPCFCSWPARIDLRIRRHMGTALRQWQYTCDSLKRTTPPPHLMWVFPSVEGVKKPISPILADDVDETSFHKDDGPVLGRRNFLHYLQDGRALVFHPGHDCENALRNDEKSMAGSSKLKLSVMFASTFQAMKSSSFARHLRDWHFFADAFATSSSGVLSSPLWNPDPLIMDPTQ